MSKIREVLRMKNLGIGSRTIAGSLKMSRNTVKEIVNGAKDSSCTWEIAETLGDDELEKKIYPNRGTQKARKLEPDYELIYKELSKPNVNLQLLWSEYRSNNSEGLMYSQFCEKFRIWSKKTNAVMILQHKPGEEMYVDWSGSKGEIIDKETGEILSTYIFVAALGASHYSYVEAFYNMKIENWILANIHAFEYFQGVPKIVVPDNLKTGVIKSNSYEPTENKTYLEMAEHYNVVIVPARVRKPRDKSIGEDAVGNIGTWILAALRNQRFFSIKEYNEAIKIKLEEYNAKPFQKREGSRKSVFETLEQSALSSLPVLTFDMPQWKSYTVPNNYHIEVAPNRYSVHYTSIGEKVDVRITHSVVEIFHKNVRIAAHVRYLEKQGEPITNPEHMPRNHKVKKDWNTVKYLSWSKQIGPSTHNAISEIINTNKAYQKAEKSCFGIFTLCDKYTPENLEKACQKAIELKSVSYTTINNILKNGMYANSIDLPTEEELVIPNHENIRGAEYYWKCEEEKYDTTTNN
jgi:transposase